jgi:hypothetical protein
MNMYSLDLYLKPTIFIEYSIGCNWMGTTIAETWECCSSENGSQCGIQEGNCYSDDDCFWHLECGTRNCQDQNSLSHFPIGSNCCYDPIPSKMKKSLSYEIIAISYRDGRGEKKD